MNKAAELKNAVVGLYHAATNPRETFVNYTVSTISSSLQTHHAYGMSLEAAMADTLAAQAANSLGMGAGMDFVDAVKTGDREAIIEQGTGFGIDLLGAWSGKTLVTKVGARFPGRVGVVGGQLGSSSPSGSVARCNWDVMPSGSAGDVLSEVRFVAGSPVELLEGGLDIVVPPGTQNLRDVMSQLTVRSGREVALLRMEDGAECH